MCRKERMVFDIVSVSFTQGPLQLVTKAFSVSLAWIERYEKEAKLFLHAVTAVDESGLLISKFASRTMIGMNRNSPMISVYRYVNYMNSLLSKLSIELCFTCLNYSAANINLNDCYKLNAKFYKVYEKYTFFDEIRYIAIRIDALLWWVPDAKLLTVFPISSPSVYR